MFKLDNRVIAIIVIIVVLLIGAVVAFTYLSTPTIYNNSSPVNNVSTTSTTTKGIDIVANQTGPAKAKKGDNVTINYTISNNGEQVVFNVKTNDQNFENTIGTLNPGETKNYSYVLHIPTDEEVQADFDSNATVSNPFFIGGFGVSFTDVNGSTHTINSNSLEIKLE